MQFLCLASFYWKISFHIKHVLFDLQLNLIKLEKFSSQIRFLQDASVWQFFIFKPILQNAQTLIIRAYLSFGLEIRNYYILMKIEEQEKKQKRTRKPTSKWTPDQCRKYLIFICAQKQKITQKHADLEVFIEMAKFIGSENKTTYECYTLHDRMKQKYKTYDEIVKQLKQRYHVKQQEIIVQTERRQNIRNKAIQWLTQQIKKNAQNHPSNFRNQQQEKNTKQLQQTQKLSEANQQGPKSQICFSFQFLQTINLDFNIRLNNKLDDNA